MVSSIANSMEADMSKTSNPTIKVKSSNTAKAKNTASRSTTNRAVHGALVRLPAETHRTRMAMTGTPLTPTTLKKASVASWALWPAG